MSTLFEDLGEALTESGADPVHLIVAEVAGSFDVIALSANDAREDSFPLPAELYHGIIMVAEKRKLGATWMHASFSMVVAQEKLPEDFFEEKEVAEHGSLLRVSRIGRPGLKYLALFEAVHRENSTALDELKNLALDQRELLKVTRWFRTEGILENRHGTRLTEVLCTLIQSESPE
ncbi:hypothetical protein N9F36_04115 [Akkermansiaceae bacterium]|nr:hypothetical protein [Akkermansiaceae bacterium]